MAPDRPSRKSATPSPRSSAGSEPATPLDQVRTQLRLADPVLARLIEARPEFDPQRWKAELPALDLFGALLFQVVGQQLSVVATRRILGRIEELFGGRLPTPVELLGAPPESLRQAGLSWRKVATLRDLAQHLSDGRLDPDVLTALPDDEVIAALTSIPGIGPWTAQGALILALGREDVVRPGDLALRKAVQRLYELHHLPSQSEVVAIAEKWRPYRSVASSYLFSAPSDKPALPSAGATRKRSDGAKAR
jgi:DNA-3-methyladenine glycosylase II